MPTPTLLVTGSSGLIGSEVCVHFAGRGWRVVGLDNNQRAVFFGPQGDTRWNQKRLQEQLGDNFQHAELDIRDRPGVLALLGCSENSKSRSERCWTASELLISTTA